MEKIRTETNARKILAAHPDVEVWLRSRKLIGKFIKSFKTAGFLNINQEDVFMYCIRWVDANHIHDWQTERRKYNFYLQSKHDEF